eukprot:711424-Karenia_brevis.AAC.1
MSAAEHAARASSSELPGLPQQAIGSGGSSGARSAANSEATTQLRSIRIQGKMNPAEHAARSSIP